MEQHILDAYNDTLKSLRSTKVLTVAWELRSRLADFEDNYSSIIED